MMIVKEQDIPSGRFVLRISPELHAQLRKLALESHVSLNEACVRLLQKAAFSPAGKSKTEISMAHALISPDLLRKMISIWQADLMGIVLFGSFAREETWDHSDVDLLLVLRPEIEVKRALYRIWDQEMANFTGPLPIAPQFVSLPWDLESPGSLWFEVAMEGIVLWDPHLKVSRFLTDLRQEIMTGRIERSFAYGQPIWTRKGEVA